MVGAVRSVTSPGLLAGLANGEGRGMGAWTGMIWGERWLLRGMRLVEMVGLEKWAVARGTTVAVVQACVGAEA